MPNFRLQLPGTLLGLLLVASSAHSADWPSWRGPTQNGVSEETGLVASWSPIWHAEFTGRSTPIVLDGRVFVIGRRGEGIEHEGVVAAFDAQDGTLLWEHAYNIFHTTIPFNRVGWASLAGDPETGYVYAHTVSGLFLCFDRDGKVVWSRSLTEEFGRISGYGGRVHTPLVDEDLVIISYLSSNWGNHTPGRHRYFAFDKRSGEVVWIATPGGRPLDTTYSVPVVATINGGRLLIGGNADGSIYAMKIRTGETVWGFKLSRRGINSSVVVAGDKVYAAHSEENLDNTALGRVVCIDATGNEVWRYDGVFAGYSSPIVHDGRLYITDNSANIHTLDAETGQVHWVHNIGTVGKGSPVLADGRLYAPEVNGRFAIVAPDSDAAETLDLAEITMPDGRPAELFGSPAVAYGRIYLSTEAGVYCLGDPEAQFKVTATAADYPREQAAPDATPTHLQIIPAEVVAQPGASVSFRARAFDAHGRLIGPVEAEWSLYRSSRPTRRQYACPRRRTQRRQNRRQCRRIDRRGAHRRAAAADLQRRLRGFRRRRLTSLGRHRHQIQGARNGRQQGASQAARRPWPTPRQHLYRRARHDRLHHPSRPVRHQEAPRRPRHGPDRKSLHPRPDGLPPAVADPHLGRRTADGQNHALRLGNRRLVHHEDAGGTRRRYSPHSRQSLAPRRARASHVDHPSGRSPAQPQRQPWTLRLFSR